MIKPIEPEAIRQLVKAGYRVATPERAEYAMKWAYFEHPEHPGELYYLERYRLGGYKVATEHKPSVECGTGSNIAEAATIEELLSIIESRPYESHDTAACGRKAEGIKRYADIYEKMAKSWTPLKIHEKEAQK